VAESVRNSNNFGTAANSSTHLLLKQESSKMFLKPKHRKDKTSMIQSHNHPLISPVHDQSRDEGGLRVSLPALGRNPRTYDNNNDNENSKLMADDESIQSGGEVTIIT
jgi:hypothetical protein